MAGLAALLSFGSDRTTTQTLDALSEALAPRGSEVAMVEYGAVRLLVRAALPKMHEAEGVVVIVDGIAETSGLISRYSAKGPSGLLYGHHPYALIAADPDGVVLARNLDGPPLYYARSRGAVLVASEPVALLAAGVPARPNEDIVGRYLAVGVCDETPATFFEGIRRVLPGQVVEICRHADGSGHSGGWAVRAHPAKGGGPSRVSGRIAQLGALGEERAGMVLLGAGEDDIALPTAALLRAALAASDSHRSVPVYSATFPELATTSGTLASAVLGPVPDNVVKHKALPVFADEIDVDGFVSDLGEPMPSLADYLLWSIAKATGGEVDVLVCASGWHGRSGHLSRLADRVAARYGVGLRFPYREWDGDDERTRAELLALTERGLGHALIRSAGAHDAALEPPLREVLQWLRAEVASALLYPKHGDPDHASLAQLARLTTVKQPELERLWRLYVLQRWINAVVGTAANRSTPEPPRAEITAAGKVWQRRLINVEPMTAGDRFAEKLAWYVAEFVNSADRSARQALRQPWLLLIAAKPIAVALGLARPIWRIEPGWLARTLARLAGGRIRHTDPWSMQIAIDVGGRLAVPAAVLCARLGRLDWYPRMIGKQAASVSPPREHACPPAHLSVVGPPEDADQTAQEIMNALRRALPEEIFDTLRGCAIVSADAEAVRPLAWSGRQPAQTELVTRLCQDNPFGQDDERTPLLLALTTPRLTTPRKEGQSRRGKRR